MLLMEVCIWEVGLYRHKVLKISYPPVAERAAAVTTTDENLSDNKQFISVPHRVVMVMSRDSTRLHRAGYFSYIQLG